MELFLTTMRHESTITRSPSTSRPDRHPPGPFFLFVSINPARLFCCESAKQKKKTQDEQTERHKNADAIVYWRTGERGLFAALLVFLDI